MGPVVQLLDRYLQVTSQIPETLQERWFQQTFQPRVVELCHALREPTTSIFADLNGLLERFELLRTDLQAALSDTELSLDMISPRLASGIDMSVIPLLGSAVGHHGAIGEGPLPTWSGPVLSSWSSASLIIGMKSRVDVLLTKTRPKRVTFIRADGEGEPFLLKGREDLRMDQRVLALLRVVNAMVLRPAAVAQL